MVSELRYRCPIEFNMVITGTMAWACGLTRYLQIFYLFLSFRSFRFFLLLIAFAPSFSLGSASYFLFYPFLDTSLSQRRVRRGFSASCYALGLCLVAIALVAQEHSRVLLGCVCSYQVALVQYRRGTLSLSWRDVNHIWEGFPFFSPCAMERGEVVC